MYIDYKKSIFTQNRLNLIKLQWIVLNLNFKTTIDVHIFISQYLFGEVGYSVATLKIIACLNERALFMLAGLIVSRSAMY